MSRFALALKALTGNLNVNLHGESQFMKIFSNFQFGDANLEKFVNQGFISNNQVYSIINRIAEDAANIPIIIENKNSDGSIEVVEEGDFYNFVHKPNAVDTYKSFVYQSIVYQLVTGNEIQYGVKGIGSNMFSERHNLAPQYITPKVKETITGFVATSYKYNYAGTNYPLAVEEVMHLKKFNPNPNSDNPAMGLSPLQALYRVLEASNELITADASLIKNKGAIGMLTPKTGGRPVTKTQAEDTDKSLKSRIGGGQNFGSIKTTTASLEFIKFAMSPQDLQILENGVVKLRDFCSAYGVSSRMFNDQASSTYNNTVEDNKKYYNNGVLPPLQNDVDHFNNFFVQGWNERDNANYSVRLDISSIEALQSDQRTEAQKDKLKMEGIEKILNMNTSEAGKQLLLVSNYDFTQEEAEALTLNNTPNNEE